MNVLLLDQTSSFVDFALRCRAAGHYARVCMGVDKATKMRSKVGDGLVEKIEREEWQAHANWADIILTSDNTRWLRELDIFRKRGFPVFAPSVASADLELLRGKGQSLFEHVGIKTMPYDVFSDYKAAEKHVLATMKRFVSKPTGDADKALSYVAKSPADMVFMLRRWAELNKIKAPFLLQEFVGGCEMAVGGWLGPKGFAQFTCENFEHKKLMNDDLGPNTGEMGTAVRYTAESTLAKEVLLPLEKELLKLGHTGFVDVAVIVDENGDPRPLEFTSRPGWPLFNIQQALHDEPVEWMKNLLDGKDTFMPSEEIAVGVVLAIPDFPYTTLTKKEVSGIPLYGLDDSNPHRAGITPCEVKQGHAPCMEGDQVVERNLMVSAGDYLAVCTGTGETVTEAIAQAYDVVESLEVPNNLMYRTDIGQRLKKGVRELHKMGFARDWMW